jgi:hypothetical protein
MTPSTPLLELLEIETPIIQAPMAGVSTPEMAAAVSNAGALGSIGVGATNAAGARLMISAFRARSRRSLNVNVFCHAPARADPAREARWLELLRPEFERLGATTPTTLTEIYRSFVEDDDMLAMLLAERPKVVSFHFGLPSRERIAALHGGRPRGTPATRTPVLGKAPTSQAHDDSRLFSIRPIGRARRALSANTTTPATPNAASVKSMRRAPHFWATTPSRRPSHQSGKFESEAKTLYFVAAEPWPIASRTIAVKAA